MTTVAHASHLGSIAFQERAEPGGERRAAKAAFREPVVGVQLVQCVDRLPVAVLCGVRHGRLEHADQEERSGREQSAAEGDQAVPGVLAPERQPPPGPGTVEDQEEPHQGRQE